uniref:rRNA biogenesis protein RRP36 n=1 Tax=Noccaea caerulescens TaxID=107243 RepID=A0A1J3H818_NOCCA
MKGGGKFEPSSSKIVFEDSEEDEEEHSDSSVSSSDEEEETEKELTLEEIHKLRADGSRAAPWKPNQEKKKSRANKNRPMELSSKRPVSRYREVIQVPKKVVRDPRFDSLSGNVDTEGFRKRYSFFFEEKLPTEREELKKQLKKTKNPEEVDELKNRLSYVEKWMKYEPSTINKGRAILTEHKKKEREAAKEGKKPYYLKKSEIRNQELIEKYNSLKASGKLESFLDKRRKKNATKDHRFMPYRRADASEQ